MLLRQVLYEFVHNTIELLRIVDEQRVSILVEAFQPNLLCGAGFESRGWHLPLERNKSESLQIQQPVMIEDFEFADCWKNIADPHEDFGLMIEWCA